MFAEVMWFPMSKIAVCRSRAGAASQFLLLYSAQRAAVYTGSLDKRAVDDDE
jgi:hypothetical protein